MRSACRKINNLLVPDDPPTIQSGVPFPGRIISHTRVNALDMGEFHWYRLLMEHTILHDGVFVWTSFNDRMLPCNGTVNGFI